MSVNGINISLGEVQKTAGTIRELNNSLNMRLGEIKKEMNALNSTWQSDGASTIISKFNNLEGKFEEYRKVIDSYAKFLDSTAEAYNTVETSINNNASAFL